MLEFVKLYKECEKLNALERSVMIAEKTAVATVKLAVLNLPEIDPVETLASFLLGAIFSDGKIDETEYLMLYPALVQAFGEEFDFESIKQTFERDKEGMKYLKRCNQDMLTILGAISEDLQAEIITLCLLVVSVDGKIKLREKNYIKQLCRC